MKPEEVNTAIDQFLNPKAIVSVSEDGMESQECDLTTGECYVIRSKDGLVERINKKYVTDDGRQLLQD